MGSRATALMISAVGLACGSTAAHIASRSTAPRKTQTPSTQEPAPPCPLLPRARRMWVGFGPDQDTRDMETALDELELVRRMLGDLKCGRSPYPPAVAVLIGRLKALEPTDIRSLVFEGVEADRATVVVGVTRGEAELSLFKTDVGWKIGSLD